MWRKGNGLLEVGFDDLEGWGGFDVGGDVLFKDFTGEVGGGVTGRTIGRGTVDECDDAVFVVYGDSPGVFAEVELLGEVVFKFPAYFID